ncbi:MAG TPA: glycosyltransferase [Bacteroidales bacterium]|jgi:dolichyl-phosphate beta-glucosyltransferase|nr:glycosyltransferase [Bacteroidales bacterium]
MSKVVVIIPCYNEADRFPQQEFFNSFISYPSMTFLFVNDGSKDATLEILQEWQKEYDNVLVIDKQPNSGKASAVRFAMLHAVEKIDFDYIAYFDADLATSLDEIPVFFNIFEQNNTLKMVVGSRVKRLGANINRKWMRHIVGRIFATCASATLLLPTYDTQCGAKMLSKDVVYQLFKDEFISKWLFDVEVFARLALIVGYPEVKNSIYEYPLDSWIEKGDSRIKLKDFTRFPIDLFRIFRKYHRSLKRQKNNFEKS